MPQPGHPGAEGLAHLETEPGGHLDQLETAVLAPLCNFLQGLPDLRVFGALVLLEQLPDLRHGEGLARRQQCTFDNLDQTRFRHIIPTLP